MEYSKQTQIILDSLGRDRKELADKLSEIDKLIKSIKLGCYNLGKPHQQIQVFWWM